MSESHGNVTKGDGYAVANLADLGEGPGFRKIRKELGVTAFGVNAIVLPPTYETGSHYHDEQEELYFVHSGESSSPSATARPTRSAPAASPGSTPPPSARCATSATPKTRSTWSSAARTATSAGTANWPRREHR